MKIEIPDIPHNGKIPMEYCFGVPADVGHMNLGENVNPHIRWSDVPEGTKSFALIVFDPDVPSKGDDVNQEGRVVPADLPRVDFHHWVLVDIPAHVREIPKGASSSGVTAKGKSIGQTEYGVTGINDYTGWFANDQDMSGNYGSYDGPCPPWNDEIIHHYHFNVFALDVETLGLAGAFGATEAKQAMEGHILDQASCVGTYAINPDAV
jgi:Raf kinase inhibitor-like YbhB/YbcL family protein